MLKIKLTLYGFEMGKFSIIFFTIKAPDKTVKKILTVLFLDVM